MGELRGYTALVTGGAQGIGFGIALELARAGAALIIADLDAEKAIAAAREIMALEQRAIAIRLDVASDESVLACVKAALDEFHRIHILVNNAGIHCEKIGQRSTILDFARCFDVNLFGVWRMTCALVPHFRLHGGGKVINIASINGRKPWADTPAYSASKAAVINLTQSMAIKLGNDNINVNAVCPGGVMTAMADAFTRDRDAFLNELIDARTIKRAILPEDIGHAVVFFASPRSHNITGQALNVDGGQVFG